MRVFTVSSRGMRARLPQWRPSTNKFILHLRSTFLPTFGPTRDGGAYLQFTSTGRTCGDTKGQQMGHCFALDGITVLSRWGTKWDTILPGWDTNLRGWDINDTKMVSHLVMVEIWASRGAWVRFSEAVRPKDRVRAVKTDLQPFCDFRQLRHNLFYELSALPRWRHGVRSRSLGGMCRHLTGWSW
jgi:hypothetical protein